MTDSPPSLAPGPPPSSRLAALRAWWREPRLTWWLVALVAVFVVLRKPSALLVPQFWAEDGSVFLLDFDRLGFAAFGEPYMGYLHTIPRLVAWLAGHTLDPAHWPAFYNGVAFALWVAVIARTFSPRLALPHKPWLALAFICGPHTGEILLNITNAQWITAFVLVQQVLIARPENWRQRFGDLVFVALVGLTGPFVIIVWPLLAWRWWRCRQADNLAVLLLASACAGVQGWLIHRANITFEYQSAPLQIFGLLTVLSRRLLIWPIFGPQLAQTLPAAVIGVAGTACLAALLLRAGRPDSRRPLRLHLVAAFLLLLLAGIARTRPDTWPGDDLAFSDRYFFLPRVLLIWLIVLEFDAAARTVAWTARLAVAAFVLVHLPHYRIEAPPDYHWAQHCDPIRRGVAADIPILPEGWTLHYPGRPGGPPSPPPPPSHLPK